MFKKIASLLCVLALCLALLPVDAHAEGVPEDKEPVVTSEPSRGADEIESPDEPGTVYTPESEELPNEPDSFDQ